MTSEHVTAVFAGLMQTFIPRDQISGTYSYEYNSNRWINSSGGNNCIQVGEVINFKVEEVMEKDNILELQGSLP